jgi:hypothetical protein
MLLKYDKIHGEIKSQNYKDIHYVGTLGPARRIILKISVSSM